MKSELITEYLLPSLISMKEGLIEGEEYLFINHSDQVYTKEPRVAIFHGPCAIVLDFGKELQGGVRIISHKFSPSFHQRIRIRFGESLGEANADLGEKNATNDHSLRDITITLNHLSDFEFGKTGYRFIRIDFLDEGEYRLVNIYGSYTHSKIKEKGYFHSSDPLLNDIYDTSKRTIFLNLQDNILEGIKRDRLVWMGDLEPEVRAMSWLYDENEYIKKAIDTSILKNPLPCWFGNIPTYSFWLIHILYLNYLHYGDIDYLSSHIGYLEGVVKQLSSCVKEDGDIDFALSGIETRPGFFFDWPSSDDLYESKEGNRYCFLLGLEAYDKIREALGLKADHLSIETSKRLKKVHKENLHLKPVIALGYLAGMIKKEEAKEKLLEGGAKGVSIRFSYHIFKAVALVASIDTAVKMCREYYGAMLERGATSFWENFDMDMLLGSGNIDKITPPGTKDIHGDFGKHCYEGYRLSLCHGWSVGPIPFLYECVLDIRILEAGSKTISISPSFSSLKKINASFPTPYGVIGIKAENNGGKMSFDIKAPANIKIIKG